MDMTPPKTGGIPPRRRASLMAFGTGSLLGSNAGPGTSGGFFGKLFRGRSNSADITASIKAFQKHRKKKLNLVKVTARLPDGSIRWLAGESGQKIEELLSDVIMEYRLSSYKVHLASTRALLNLDADAGLIQGEEITIEEDNGVENVDPRIAADPGLRIVHNLLKTEKHYQECVRSIYDVYAEPLRKFSSLSNEDHRVLFFGLEPIISFSTTLCIKLEDAILTWDPGTTRIGNLFSKQFWHHYEEYYYGYSAVRSLLREKRQNDEEFVQFCQLRRGAARHSLESLLLLPVKRIPEYDDYLTSLLSQTDKSHPDYDDLNKAATKVKNMVKEREEESMTVENEHRVDSVQERFPNDNLQLLEKEKKGKARRRSGSGAVWLRTLSKKHHHSPGDNKVNASPLAVPPDPATVSRTISGQKIDRRYVLEGPVQLTVGLQTHDRYLFLFNDLLLVAKQRSSVTFKLKQRVRVCEMWTSEHCMDEVSEATRTADKSFVIGWPTTNCVATFASQEMRDVWLEKLKEQILSEKEKEQPKTVILKIVNKDMENLAAATKRLLVSNYEQAEDLVRKCIDEFRIKGGEAKDYQLWVVSGKEDSPYPLIGHEHPYSIWMSHLKDERKDGTADREEVLLPVEMDMNDNSVQCQFVMRETKKVHKKISLEEAAKIKKKSKSPLINFFRKHKNNTSSSGPPGKLFGHNLSDICENDEIPKQIMDLMQQLFMLGPYTQGIFRKSANHKRCQEIRTILDAGEYISVDELPVTVACSVLKDFMRSLPDCVLLCDMYDSWVDTIPIADTHIRADRTATLLAKLPKCHQSFLEHLMCILFYVDKFSHENSMNAFNLSICVSQSMLWPHYSLGAGIQTEAVEKAPLVIQFMIENCLTIFGEKCIKLFGDPIQGKPRQDSSTDSDSIQSMLSVPGHIGTKVWDDSSVDSLDHGIHGEIDSSPQLMKSPTNLSRDSGLTLSDNQLYDESEAMPGGAAPARKQSITRSTSQFDAPKASADPGQLSRSYDCTIDSLHQQAPVPPPRKSRHSKKGPGGVDYTDSRSAIQRRPAMRHPALPSGYSQSSSGVSEGSLGSLDESTEIETPDDIQLEFTGDDIGVLRKSSSGAKLYVREDPVVREGGRRRLDYHLNRRSAPPQVQEVDKLQQALARHDSLKKKSDPRSASFESDIVTSQSWSDLAKLAESGVYAGGGVQPIPENQPLNLGASRSHTSPGVKHHPTSPPESPGSRHLAEEFAKSSYTFMVPVTSNATSTPEKSAEYRFVVPAKGSSMPNNRSAAVRPQTLSPRRLTGARSVDSDPLPVLEPMDYSPCTPSPQSVHSDPLRLNHTRSEELLPQSSSRSSNSKSRPLLRMEAVDMDVSEGPKSPAAEGMEPLLRQKRTRSGMTATGADIFPDRLKSLYRHSLDEQTIIQAVQKGVAGPPALAVPVSELATKQSLSSHADSTSGGAAACHRSDSYAGPRPSGVDRHRRGDYLEKSSSDTSVKDHFETRAQQERAANDRSRPSKPPSYQEAMHRKSLLKSGMPTFQLTQKDIIEQSEKGAKARKLYEESLKKYMQESSPPPREHGEREAQPARSTASRGSTPVRHQSPGPSGGGRSQSSPARASPAALSTKAAAKQPPSYEQACQRAEIYREHKQKTERNPPSYQSHMRDTHSQSPASEAERPSRHPSNASSSSREGTPGKGSLSRESSTGGSGRAKRKRDRNSSRSKERRIVHRLSDTRIYSNTARDSTNLCRSKSDSSEHLHRITKFKQKSDNNKENVSADDLSTMHVSRDMDMRRALTPEKNSTNVPANNLRNATPERQHRVEREVVSTKEDKHRRQSNPIPAVNLVKLQRTMSDERPRDIRSRRRSVPSSMKNRDWHKELADTYNNVFYQPKEEDDDKVIYSYTGPEAAVPRLNTGDSGNGQRKGWQRPVHPTKDLVISRFKDYNVRKMATRGMESPEKTIVLETRFRSSSDGLSRYESQTSPSASTSNKQAKLDTPVVKKDAGKETPRPTEPPQQEEPEGINWSVKKLMNLYDEKRDKRPLRSSEKNAAAFYQPNSEPPAARQRGQSPYKHPSKGGPDRVGAQREKTNPRAEEAYV